MSAAANEKRPSRNLLIAIVRISSLERFYMIRVIGITHILSQMVRVI